MSGCQVDLLEDLLDGTLPSADAHRLELHLPTCRGCADELAWLRTERRLMSARRHHARRVPARIWMGVQQKLAERREPVQRWFTSRVRWLELMTAFAVVLVSLVPLMGAPSGTLSADAHDRAGAMCLIGNDKPGSGAERFSRDDGLTCPLVVSSAGPMSTP